MFFRQNGLKSQMELSIQQLESDVQEKQVQAITAFLQNTGMKNYCHDKN